MKTGLLEYDLPPRLIAQEPRTPRDSAKLLVLNRRSGLITDSSFRNIGDFLSAGDCLVLNDTRVLPARFRGRRSTGGRFEGLFLSEKEAGLWLVMLKGSRKLKTGESVELLAVNERYEPVFAVLVEKAAEGTCLIRLQRKEAARRVLARIGYAPLPPYIKRQPGGAVDISDKRSYQTVYARRPGAVAAPTAGLHFTSRLIKRLAESGIAFNYVTLHTGPGTFKPIKTETIDEHRLEKEYFVIDALSAEKINKVKAAGGRIVAVGTTSVRTLETSARGGKVIASRGWTDLFVKPPYRFKVVDALVTNFHLPRSSLLALVVAFGGKRRVFSAYRHAVEKEYHFYSYGDAMLLI